MSDLSNQNIKLKSDNSYLFQALDFSNKNQQSYQTISLQNQEINESELA